ncbi:MAG: beta-lactamase family protein [Chloroflexi bacterium]|nr:beta-lactamase family protein [Chloroflexota bacterium]
MKSHPPSAATPRILRQNPTMISGGSTWRALLVLLLLFGSGHRAVWGAANEKSGEEGESIRQFEQIIQAELSRGSISGVSIALVEDQRTIYAKGFGFANKARRVPASQDTVYRAGSISKLFTALAAMQLAEQGKVDIDQPVSRYDPGFRVVVPFDNAKPITLRELMCHRAGLIRESPVGSYFDDSEPGIARTVSGLESCVLVHPPDTRTKYSNSGVTIIGQVVEKVSGLPFVEYQEKHLLRPIGMRHSAFLLTAKIKPHLAKGYLPVADGKGGFREMEAPQFELGILPAGNLYTTAKDLATFLSFLFAPGRAGDRLLLKPETLAEMFTPQLIQGTNGFGLGFSIGHFRSHKTVSHTGAVYGFTSSITALPEHRIGVVILCNDDIAIGPVAKLNEAALTLMLAAKTGETPPPPAQVAAAPLEPDSPLVKTAAVLAGDYESESYWAKIEWHQGALKANISGQRLDLQPMETPDAGGHWKFDGEGRCAHTAVFVFEQAADGLGSGFTALGQRFRRVDASAVAPAPGEWNKFLGSYGPAFIPLIIIVKHGHLYAMTENSFDYRLTPLNRFVFKMPPGLYIDEQLVFHEGADGRIQSVVLANMKLPRRRR